MSIKTQGSELYLIDGSSVVKMDCPTGITGVGSGSADQIDVTCLNETAYKAYVGGLNNPGQVSVPFIFDPQYLSQQTLLDLRDSREVVGWAVGFSDGTAAPTIVSGDFSFPTTRTYASFDAYIADFNIDVATNEVVRGTMTLQCSLGTAWSVKV